MSLEGKRIVVTRAAHQAESLANLLRDKGAIPIFYPCIAIYPVENSQELDAALKRIETYDYLLITSSNTAYALKQRLDALKLSPDFSRLKIAAIGESSAEAVTNFLGAEVAFMPEMQTGAALAQSLPIVNKMRVFLPQSTLANEEICQTLTERGAIVESITAYENHIGEGGANVPAMLKQGEIDALTFTSSSTVDYFLKRIAPQTAFELPAAVIGSSTAKTAHGLGFQQLIMPDEYNLAAMLALLDEYFDAAS